MEHIKDILKNLNPKELELSSDEDERQPNIEIKRQAWLASCGVPLRYKEKSFANFQVSKGNKKAFGKCKDFAEAFPLRKPVDYKSLGLFSDGVWGVGKTHLVCAVAKCLIERCQFSCPVLYLTEPELFQRIRATFDHKENGETERDVMKELTTIPLLIVDDVGKVEVSDPRFVQRVWFEIINGRYDSLLPVVITANLNPDQIANHLGGSRGNEAVFDRLWEMLQGIFCEITGESYRREQWKHG